MTALMAWLSNFLIGLLTPLIEKLIANSVIASKVISLENNQTALIKAVGLLSSATTSEEIKNAIKEIAAADNA